MVRSYRERANARLDAYNKAYHASKSRSESRGRRTSSRSSRKDVDKVLDTVNKDIAYANQLLGKNNTGITSVISGETVSWSEGSVYNNKRLGDRKYYSDKEWEEYIKNTGRSGYSGSAKQSAQGKESVDWSISQLNRQFDMKCMTLEKKITKEYTGLFDGWLKKIMDMLSLDWFAKLLIALVTMWVDMLLAEPV